MWRRGVWRRGVRGGVRGGVRDEKRRSRVTELQSRRPGEPPAHRSLLREDGPLQERSRHWEAQTVKGAGVC